MSGESQKTDEAIENERERDNAGQAFLRDPRVLRMASTVCVGLAQGIAFFFMIKSPVQWRWYITASMLPLPFYLARDMTWRVAAAAVPWCAILLLLDGARIFFRYPYSPLYAEPTAILMAACAGAILTLPGFVSWIDGDGAFPEWRVSFRNFSRVFFASIIAGLFLILFFAALTTGAALTRIIGGGVAKTARWLVRNFIVVAFAAWGAAFYWTARSDRLIDVLERYVLPIFSCLMPVLSVFTLTFAAALPMGIKNLWGRGLASDIILGAFLATGLCAFAAWRDGFAGGENPREPFFRPVNALVKISLVALPVFCPILVYTIGIRIGQYGLTVDRAFSFALNAAFGLWSLAWAFFLVRRWKKWPVFYGMVNRAAFPALGAALILFSSPVCDVRRIVLNKRLEWLRESIRKGEDAEKFDWRYTARRLGVYGIRAAERLDAGGEALIAEKLGPFASGEQAAQIRDLIAKEVASVKRDYETLNAQLNKTSEQRNKENFENLAQSAREAPVFGGELSPGGRERLIRARREDLFNRGYYDSDWKVSFFCLEDMNGDGEPEVLLGIGNDIFLLRDDRALKLGSTTTNYSYGNESDEYNKMAISSGDKGIIKNRWDILRIKDRIFFVEPSDIINGLVK
ncbi:MAG: DUF4153 domain-containing protein [Synergistaceae bacterium]|jgi:hypothetical protein|nr:DUF4153 domain-containing protein [Synergistaceae bacterium]